MIRAANTKEKAGVILKFFGREDGVTLNDKW